MPYHSYMLGTAVTIIYVSRNIKSKDVGMVKHYGYGIARALRPVILFNAKGPRQEARSGCEK